MEKGKLKESLEKEIKLSELDKIMKNINIMLNMIIYNNKFFKFSNFNKNEDDAVKSTINNLEKVLNSTKRNLENLESIDTTLKKRIQAFLNLLESILNKKKKSILNKIKIKNFHFESEIRDLLHKFLKDKSFFEEDDKNYYKYYIKDINTTLSFLKNIFIEKIYMYYLKKYNLIKKIDENTYLKILANNFLQKRIMYYPYPINIRENFVIANGNFYLIPLFGADSLWLAIPKDKKVIYEELGHNTIIQENNNWEIIGNPNIPIFHDIYTERIFIKPLQNIFKEKLKSNPELKEDFLDFTVNYIFKEFFEKIISTPILFSIQSDEKNPWDKVIDNIISSNYHKYTTNEKIDEFPKNRSSLYKSIKFRPYPKLENIYKKYKISKDEEKILIEKTLIKHSLVKLVLSICDRYFETFENVLGLHKEELITKIKEKLNYEPNSIAKIENMILENKLKDITNIQEEITLKEISIMREEIKKDLNNILNKFLEYLQKETPRYIIDINELFFDLDINELFFKFLNVSNFRYDEKVIELLNKLKGENKEEINGKYSENENQLSIISKIKQILVNLFKTSNG